METFTIGFVIREMALQGAYLFDNLSNINSLENVKYYLYFLIIDNSDVVQYCYIPQTSIEEYQNNKIKNIAAFCEAAAGHKIILEIGEEISNDKHNEFMKGDILFPLFKNGNTYKMIKSFSLDLNNKSEIGIKMYQHLLKLNKGIQFKETPGSIKFIDGGYDIDSTFDGNADAYWNLD